MINANELRLGNYVLNSEDEICTVISPSEKLTRIKTKQGWEACHKDELHPIPLTEEWLLKLGFEQEYKSEYTIKYGIPEYSEFEYVLHLAEKKEFLRWKGDIIKCNSIHNLQNIFFVLTGEELTCID